MLKGRNAAPLNHYPAWKYGLIVILVVVAFLYALPNIFGESPAVQISPKGGKALSADVIAEVTTLLKKDHIPYQKTSHDQYLMELTFANTDVQMQAQEAIKQVLGKNYSVAINLAPNTPKWLTAIGANPMKYGLDLRGGMYFLLDIDMQTVVKNQMDNIVSQLRQGLRAEHIRYRSVKIVRDQVVLKMRSKDAMDAAQGYLQKNFPNLLMDQDSVTLTYKLSVRPQALQEIKQYAVEQTTQVMRNRVNELGVAEASVSRQGTDRVVIELPGVQDAAKAKEVIGGTATLKLMLVDEAVDQTAMAAGRIPVGSSLYHFSPDLGGGPIALKNQVILTGKSIVGATAGYDQQTNLPVVNVNLSGPEVSRFSRVTAENVGKRMAIVLVQSMFTKEKVKGQEVTKTTTTEDVVNAATIRQQLGNRFQISGIGNMRAAQLLALTIRAGSLPAPVQIVESKQIGPSLGQDNIRMGQLAVTIAMGLVVIFMAIYYRLFGVVADIALGLNIVFIVAVMSIIPGATLTLPGIAGIVLNVGMAIDANVLIFERIREELRNGNSPQASIHAGYERAFGTIVDSNVTTLIVAVILFAIGTGAVKGFAVTLTIGIITSMFTALTFTRALVNLIYGKRKIQRLSIGI